MPLSVLFLQLLKVVVTEIISCSHFWAQLEDQGVCVCVCVCVCVHALGCAAFCLSTGYEEDTPSSMTVQSFDMCTFVNL